MRRCCKCGCKSRTVIETYYRGSVVHQCRSAAKCEKRATQRIADRLAAFERLMAAGVDMASLVANHLMVSPTADRGKAAAAYMRWGEALIDVKRLG